MGLAISKFRRRHRVTRTISPGVDADALRARLASLERSTPSPTAGYVADPDSRTGVSEHATPTFSAMSCVTRTAPDIAPTKV
ncbi:uncharacterized protein COLE_02146 [Cutaneotrichosporon oleaginosum]|nr:hypothetical protein COLE_02146 [Cutaneotrichosporon oleaginosum]